MTDKPKKPSDTARALLTFRTSGGPNRIRATLP
jgi:hypothetical protein